MRKAGINPCDDREIGPRRCAVTGNNKLAAGGAVTLSAAGNKGIGTVELTLFVIGLALLCGAALDGHQVARRLRRHALPARARRQAARVGRSERKKPPRRSAARMRPSPSRCWPKRSAGSRPKNRRAMPTPNGKEPAVKLAAMGHSSSYVRSRDRIAARWRQLVKALEAMPHRELERMIFGSARPGRAVFTWQFVREYDAAWTGADGKPVSQDPAGQPAAQTPVLLHPTPPTTSSTSTAPTPAGAPMTGGSSQR
jgi:hypothetical protein